MAFFHNLALVEVFAFRVLWLVIAFGDRIISDSQSNLDYISLSVILLYSAETCSAAPHVPANVT